MSQKLQSLSKLKSFVSAHQQENRTVVFVNGCFDLLHAGHIRYLEAASALGDLLVLGLNSDNSVRELKGPERPVMNQEERTEILAALECVDYIVVFDDPRADQILSELKPDIHAKGPDYTHATVPERETVLSYGGLIAIVGDAKKRSTHNFIERIKGADTFARRKVFY